ncbi:MAG: Digeranylgeranylglycerophospholipid reductase [Candidatus Syntrophoarchaeum sp. GoM_oil]|nr:MAG: Digeranylgeranylglycerophospholipid reductase [Candidatus Syntrophoarchaeum sp. GoM_oil]
MKYDVAIGGAGFAGLMIARELARGGLKVAVFEKSNEIGYPVRSTTTTFIYPNKALFDEFEISDTLVRSRYDSLNFCNGAGKSLHVQFERDVMVVMNFRDFRQYQAIQAISEGVDIYLQSPVIETIRKDGFVRGVRVKIEGRKEDVDCDIVVDSTGSEATLTNDLNLNKPRLEAICREFDVYTKEINPKEFKITVGTVPGYAYAFPLDEKKVRVGFAAVPAFTTGELNINDLVKALFRENNLSMKNAYEAHPVTTITGGVTPKPYANGFVSVGDAAGQLSPVIGEGIRFILRSSVICADTIMNAFDKGDFSSKTLKAYKKEWDKLFGFKFMIAARIQGLVSNWDDDKWAKAIDLFTKLSDADNGFMARFLSTEYTRKDLLNLIPLGLSL